MDLSFLLFALVGVAAIVVDDAWWPGMTIRPDTALTRSHVLRSATSCRRSAG